MKEICTRNALSSCIVFLDGPIVPGTFERVKAIIDGPREGNDVLFMNSRGGDLLEALRIGRFLRERGFHTKVGKEHDFVDDPFPLSGVCESACAYIFMGGDKRSLRQKDVLGVHRFFASGRDLDGDDVQELSGHLITYMVEMGVDARLFALASREGQDGMHHVSMSEARQYDLVTEDAYTELSLEPYRRGVVAWTRPSGPSAPGNVEQVTFFCQADAPKIMFFKEGKGARVDLLTQPGFGTLQATLDRVPFGSDFGTFAGRSSQNDGLFTMTVTSDFASSLLLSNQVSLTIWYPTVANATMSATLDLSNLDRQKIQYAWSNCVD